MSDWQYVIMNIFLFYLLTILFSSKLKVDWPKGKHLRVFCDELIILCFMHLNCRNSTFINKERAIVEE